VDGLSDARLLSRNFYGALRVADDQESGVRELAHGTISHGEQYLDPAQRRRPLTYYAADTGIGLLMTDLEKNKGAIWLGVIGLGTGSMAAWGRAGDMIRFYEINERVLDIARTQFTFLADCASHTEVVLGDARLSLEREPAQQFDVLVVDAFSGDSIPIHLLTREAFEVYFRHLKPDGILAVHVSNSYLDLAPPVAALARQMGREAHLVQNEEDDRTRTFPADWVLVGDHESERFPWIKDKESTITLKSGLRIWTDDFSNLWQILNL
jgi:predicted O-methyltransferase YrrM